MGRALLIGGAGFIGSHLSRELVARGHDVVVLDDDRSYLPDADVAAAEARAWRRQTLLGDVDVRCGRSDDAVRLAEIIGDTRPDTVVQLANLPLAGVAVEEPDLARRSIVDGTRTVLEVVEREAPGARLTFVSSSMVYGDFTHDPQPETAPTAPREPYGRCKLEAEGLVRASVLPWTIVRPSAVYGPGDANGRFLQRLVDAALAGTPLTLTADPASSLDFTWVGDLAAGLATAATADAARHETFNLTAGRGRSLGDAIAAVREHGYDVDVQLAPHTTFHPRRGTLDIAKARRLLAFAPSQSLEDGLGAYLGAKVAAP